ncbi:hypothetical protein [Streptomyces sp. NPDC002403]
MVRKTGVYPGNIYLASEQSVALPLNTAHGTEPSASDGPSATVRLEELPKQMHALELLYRFPVAYKFRGTHGPERQCLASFISSAPGRFAGLAGHFYSDAAAR